MNLLRVRKQIEASFSTLVRSLTLQAAQAKTFLSLTRTRSSSPKNPSKDGLFGFEAVLESVPPKGVPGLGSDFERG